MADVFGALFILQLLIVFGIFGLKLYNIMRMGALYDIYVGVVLFIGFFLAYFLGLVVVLTNPEEILYFTIWKFQTYLVLLNFLFLAIELFIYLGSVAKEGTKDIMKVTYQGEKSKLRI